MGLSRDFVRATASGDLGVAITGAGSWLGQAQLALLARNGALTSQTRLRLFGSVARPMRIADRIFAIEPLSAAGSLDGGAWLLLHFAFLGKERTGDLDLTTFLAGNDAILADTLRVVADARDLRFVFTSSGAAHTPDCESNPYGWCKAAHERRIVDWCGERNVPLLIPRIFNVGGPYANKLESYALSSMILSAMRRGEIVIRAEQPTFRSYVHIDELLEVLCEAALAKPPGTPAIFDTAGLETVEMEDLANSVAAALAPERPRITRAPMTGNQSDRYLGNGAAWRALLASHGRSPVSLEAIVADTVADIRLRAASPGEELMRA